MFVTIAAVGFGFLLLALLFDGLLGGFLPTFGWLSVPSLGAALAAFGVTGWVLHSQAEIPTGPAAGAGAAAAVVNAVVAYRLSRAAMEMATDATPDTGNLLGASGRVVTPIAAESTGEVLIELAGQPVKLSATTADGHPLTLGASIVVVSVRSPTRVVVEDATSFWTIDDPTGGDTDA
jgi:hypothetical protein